VLVHHAFRNFLLNQRKNKEIHFLEEMLERFNFYSSMILHCPHPSSHTQSGFAKDHPSSHTSHSGFAKDHSLLMRMHVEIVCINVKRFIFYVFSDCNVSILYAFHPKDYF
jgi:hypothetical protein